MPTEVFLSHSSTVRDFASRLAEMLRRHGVPVWYSETNIVGARQWNDEIGEALRRCDWFVVVLSARRSRDCLMYEQVPVFLVNTQNGNFKAAWRNNRL